ncbi:hypothetical protein Fmac_007173 [Flemingia macrophylla]|uniref:Uncharacterized protein n=1 Tax=Flemingia macrophylla TaxID=520843 RepID=A0ABD1NE93_9FABA
MRKSGEEAAAEGVGIWDCGSPLYDSYELVSLSHTIQRHMMGWLHHAEAASKPKELALSTQTLSKHSSRLTNFTQFFTKFTPQKMKKEHKKIKARCSFWIF